MRQVLTLQHFLLLLLLLVLRTTDASTTTRSRFYLPRDALTHVAHGADPAIIAAFAQYTHESVKDEALPEFQWCNVSHSSLQWSNSPSDISSVAERFLTAKSDRSVSPHGEIDLIVALIGLPKVLVSHIGTFHVHCEIGKDSLAPQIWDAEGVFSFNASFEIPSTNTHTDVTIRLQTNTTTPHEDEPLTTPRIIVTPESNTPFSVSGSYSIEKQTGSFDVRQLIASYFQNTITTRVHKEMTENVFQQQIWNALVDQLRTYLVVYWASPTCALSEFATTHLLISTGDGCPSTTPSGNNTTVRAGRESIESLFNDLVKDAMEDDDAESKMKMKTSNTGIPLPDQKVPLGSDTAMYLVDGGELPQGSAQHPFVIPQARATVESYTVCSDEASELAPTGRVRLMACSTWGQYFHGRLIVNVTATVRRIL